LTSVISLLSNKYYFQNNAVRETCPVLRKNIYWSSANPKILASNALIKLSTEYNFLWSLYDPEHDVISLLTIVKHPG